MEKLQEFSILVVEDEKPLQKAIRTKLEREGFSVVTAVDVDQGLAYLDDKDMSINAVWLDHYLFGKKDGLDFIAIAQEKGYLKDVPVFVVTNTGGHEKRETYLSLGATDYHVKSDNRLDQIVTSIKSKLTEDTK